MEAIKLSRLDTKIMFIDARINLSRFVVAGGGANTSSTVFFFQAEDGIRYWSVTGVQTCALPILPLHHLAHAVIDDYRELVCECWVVRAARSEERRVGKECSSRLLRNL